MAAAYLQIVDDSNAAAGWCAVGWFKDSRAQTSYGATVVSGEENARSQLQIYSDGGYRGWYVVQDQQGRLLHQGRYGAQNAPGEDYQPYAQMDLMADGSWRPWQMG